MATFPRVLRPEDDPNYQSVMNPPRVLPIQNQVANRVVRSMIGEDRGIFGRPAVTDQDVSEFRSQQQPSFVGPSQEQQFRQRSDQALDSYTKKVLGIGDTAYDITKAGGQVLADQYNPIDPQTGLPNVGIEHSVVPTAIKLARREAAIKSGLAPIKRLEGGAEEVARRIGKRDVDFHATGEKTMPKIIETGAIMPNELLHQGQGYKASQAAIAQKAEAYKAQNKPWKELTFEGSPELKGFEDTTGNYGVYFGHAGNDWEAMNLKTGESYGKSPHFEAAKKLPFKKKAKEEPNYQAIVDEHKKLMDEAEQGYKDITDFTDKHPLGGTWKYPEQFAAEYPYEQDVQDAWQKWTAKKGALEEFENKHNIPVIKQQLFDQGLKSDKWTKQANSFASGGDGAITDVTHDPQNGYAIAKGKDGKYYSYEISQYNDTSGKLVNAYYKTHGSKPAKDAKEAKKNLINWLESFKDMHSEEAINPNIVGVSTSRIPRVFPKEEKAISMQIDPKKMPKNRPFSETEMGYGKTTTVDKYDNVPTLDEMTDSYLDKKEWDQYQQAKKAYQTEIDKPGHAFDYDATDQAYNDLSHWEAVAKDRWENSPPEAKMNKRFEYENRTYGKPIDFSAVNEILIDRSALKKSADPYSNVTWETHATPEEKAHLLSMPAGIPSELSAKQKYFNDTIKAIVARERAKNPDPVQKVVEKLRQQLGPDFPITVYDTGRQMHRHRVEQFKGQNKALEGKSVSPLREQERRIGSGILNKLVQAQTPIPVEKLVQSTEGGSRAVVGDLLKGKKEVTPEQKTQWIEYLKQVLGAK